MHSRPTKKGVSVIAGIICLIALVGNVTDWLMPNQSYHAQIENSVESKLNEDSIKDKELDSADQLEKTNNILVVGIDGITNEDVLRADSILLVSINPTSNRIYLTSFLRDTYVQIPGGGNTKLSLSYGMGGTKLLKETIEANFDLVVDQTVTINMKAFEDIINTIGGVNIELSEEEAAYLNTTNYISDNRYRNVSAGEQILNGNQALGYVRIRKVPTPQGEREDLGRTVRLRYLLLQLITEGSNKEVSKLIPILTEVMSNMITDMDLDQALIYLNMAMQKDITTETLSIPIEGSYTFSTQDGRGVLEPDLEKNKMVLEQIMH